MEGNNNKITKGQNSAMIIATVIGVGVLSLPSSLAKDYGTDGWILLLLGGIIIGILGTIMTKVSLLYPNKTAIEYGREITTTPISDIVAILFLAYVLTNVAYVVRIFAEVTKMFLLFNTPTEVIIITMLFTCGYLIRKGIEAIARVMAIIIPIVFIPVLLLALPVFIDIKLDNILPMFHSRPIDIIKGLPAIVLSFAGFEIILINTAYIEERKNLLKYNLLAIGFITIAYMGAFFVSLARFGEDELTHLIWPTLSLMQTVDFPGAFLENIQGIVMALWILMVFGSIVPIYFNATLIISKVARTKEFRYFVYPLIPLLYFMALIPDNLVQTYELTDLIEKYLAIFVLVAVPIAFGIIVLIRKKFNKGAKDNA